MKYEEISKDTTNEIVAKRIELEKKEKEAAVEYGKAADILSNARGELRKLQNTCKHEHAIFERGWQGGGIYYCYCYCPECGRNGTRYVPQYHMKENNDWYKDCKKEQITLEKAIELGKRIGESLFESEYWWGEVENYKNIIWEKE